jgi:hypothetical protein
MNTAGNAQMNHWTLYRSAAQLGRRRIGFASFALLGVIATAAHAHADSAASRWQVSFPVYLSAGAYYQSDGETTDTFQAVAGSVEALFSSQAHPYSVGLFVGQVYSPDGRQNGAVFAGGLFEHELRKWDSAVSLFRYDAHDSKAHWKYFSRVRYRFAARHKLGIEVVGPLRDPSASNLMVGYYGTITKSFSVNFVVGSKLKSGQKRIARTELVWQFN